MSKISRKWICGAVLAVMTACPQWLVAASAPSGEAIQLFESALPQLRALHPGQYDTPEKLQAAWQRFQEMLALAETARKKGLAESPEVRYRIAQILSQELILREAETAVPPHAITDSDVRKYFDAHKDKYEVPPMLGVHEILLKIAPGQPNARMEQWARATNIVRALGTGVVDVLTFNAYARTNSDPQAFGANEGYLGIFPARPYNGRSPPLSAAEVKELSNLGVVGRITKPMDKGNEIRIFRLSAFRDAVPAHFESVKDSIRYHLHLKAREKKIQELAAESGMHLDVKLDEQTVRRLLPAAPAQANGDLELPPSPGGLGLPIPDAPSRPIERRSQ